MKIKVFNMKKNNNKMCSELKIKKMIVALNDNYAKLNKEKFDEKIEILVVSKK